MGFLNGTPCYENGRQVKIKYPPSLVLCFLGQTTSHHVPPHTVDLQQKLFPRPISATQSHLHVSNSQGSGAGTCKQTKASEHPQKHPLIVLILGSARVSDSFPADNIMHIC